MRRIFKSYLKLFLSSWLETLGTLLFLITFIIVILSMLPAPLQISLMANRTNKHTNQWDYSVELRADNVSSSKVREGKVNTFSVDFLEAVSENFIAGYALARKEDTKSQKELEEAYLQSAPDDIYPLISKSGKTFYLSFVKTENPVESLFTDWFEKAEDALIEIFKIINNNSIYEESNWNQENKRKYNADIFIRAADIFSTWSHNEETMLGDPDDNYGIKSLYLEIISDVVGYSFVFGDEWKEGSETAIPNKVAAHKLFTDAFADTKINGIFNKEAINYFYLDGQDEYSIPAHRMQRDIWNAIQTNVYDQLNINYSRENTIFTNANIGTNKNQLVNFTEIGDKNTEKNKINNLVWNKKGGYASDVDNLNELDVFGNDKFLNSISKYDNEFQINGVNIKLNNTYVAYKLNALTAKQDSYNYSIFTSKPEFTGELYVREGAFKAIYDKFASNVDNNIPYEGKSSLRIRSTFYLSWGKKQASEGVSYLLGDVSNKNQNVFSVDTSYLYPKNKSPQLQMITMVNLMTIIYSVIGMILLLLASVFMLYSQKEELNRTRKQLGVFKSNGYKTWELCLPSTLKVFLLIFAGLLIGYLCSFPLQMNAVDKQFGTIGIFEINRIYANPVFLFLLLIVIPSLFTLIIFLVLLKFLSETPLDLMKVGAVSNYIKYPWWYWVILPLSFPFVLIHKLITYLLSKTRFGFTFRLQSAFLSISKGKFTIVMILFSFATFLVAMEMKAMPVMNNMFNEATAYLKNSTDHESYVEGDYLTDTDEDGKQEMTENRFIGRKFIDLNGRKVDEFLNDQEKMKDDNKEKVMDDFVFDSNTLIEKLVDKRVDYLEKVKKWSDLITPEQKDKLMKLSSVFAFGALVMPVETVNSFDKVDKLVDELIAEIIATQPSTDEKINKLIKKYINKFSRDICENGVCGESLLNSKLSDNNEQLEKIKAINANDIFKITWMLLSSFISDIKIEDAQLKNISEIKKYIASAANVNIPQTFSSKSEDESIDDIVKWIQDQISEIIEFIQVDDNVEIIKNAVLNSNFVKRLLQPILLTNNEVNPLITNNSVVFDSKKETLVRHENIRINDHNYVTTMMSFDTTNKFGDLRNQYLFDGVWNWHSLGKKNDDGSINVVISKPIAKIKNLGVGDTFDIYDKGNSGEQKPIVGKVIGIQVRNIAVHMIFADYNRLIEARTSDREGGVGYDLRDHKYKLKTGEVYNDIYAFNKVVSSKKKISLPLGDLELDFSKLADKFSFTQDSYSFMTSATEQNKVSWFTSMIAGSSYLDKVLNSNKVNTENNPFIKGQISSSSFFDAIPSVDDIMLSYTVIKAGVAAMISMITNMMIVNIVISLILLLILFTVLIKIIIHDASGIIILMRSLGYRDIQINWIVIGKYLTSSIIAFIIMYALSFMMWTGIAEFAWNKYAVILAIPIYWYLPLVIFVVMESVVTIGFLFGVYRLKKLPLARL